MTDKYVKLDEKKIKRLIREAQMFQDDIVCAIGTDFMQNIATAENKMIFDILEGLLSEPAADVVEVKHARWKLHGGDDDMELYGFCTNCGRGELTEDDIERLKPKLCPYCGAEMEVE